MSGERLPDIEISLPARPESVSVARQAVSGLADALGWNGQFLADLKIAVSEACTNAVVHAYPEGEPGNVIIRAWLDSTHLRLSVSDEGSGINPKLSEGAAGLGLGLPLMAALSEEVSVKSGPEGPTVVRLTFAIPPSEAAE